MLPFATSWRNVRVAALIFRKVAPSALPVEEFQRQSPGYHMGRLGYSSSLRCSAFSFGQESGTARSGRRRFPCLHRLPMTLPSWFNGAGRQTAISSHPASQTKNPNDAGCSITPARFGPPLSETPKDRTPGRKLDISMPRRKSHSQQSKY